MTIVPPQLQAEGLLLIKVRSKDKIPLEKGWQDAANYVFGDERLIAHIKKGGNYGVACGFGGLVVLDVDNVDRFKELVDHSKLPSTFTVKTGGGGYHFYFICPDLDKKIILEDSSGSHVGELQAWGTQVVGPGSIHPNGNVYEVVNDAEIAQIGASILKGALSPLIPKSKLERNAAKLESLKGEARRTKVARESGNLGPYARKALEDEISKLLATSEGDRNNRLNRSAISLFGLVKAGVLCRSEVESELSRAARSTGLEPAEITKTIASAWNAATERDLPEPNTKPATEDAAALLENLPDQYADDPDVILDPAIQRALATLRRSNRLGFELLLKEAKIRGDVKKALLADLDKLDEEPEIDEPEPIPEDLRAKAEDILESGDPIQARCDYVARHVHSDGDAERALIFSCESVFMPKRDKLHSDISGSSQAGKSERAGAAHSTYPPENVISLTEASPKSLYYLAQKMKKEGKTLDDMLIYIDDARVDHIPVLKVFRNDGPIDPRNLTVVDGEISDQDVPGHPVVQASSVVPLRDFEEQNTSRTFLISVPDADEATERKVRAKIRHRLEYGALLGEENDKDKLVLQEMGRIIRDEGIRDVVVPFDVVEPKSADRRGTGQFLRLIKVSAHANQYQRPILEMKDGSQYILATYADLKAAAEVWFSFEEAQAYKITDKALQVFRKLPNIEPPHDVVGTKSPTKNVLAATTEINPKTTERLLADLYDAGLIFRKKVSAPGNPYVYWTTPDLRQKVMSQISVTGDPQTELGQIKTKSGCPKYLGKNCSDSLETSIYSFFTNQDIIKREMLKGIIRRHVDGSVESLVLGEDMMSSFTKVQNLVLNGVSKPLDSDYLRHSKMSEEVETDEMEPLDSGSLRQDDFVSNGGKDVSKTEHSALEVEPAKTGKIPRKTPPAKRGRRLDRINPDPKHELNLKAFAYSTGKAGEYAPISCNLYGGCTHGCEYCYNKTKFKDPNRRIKKSSLQNIENSLNALAEAKERGPVHFSFIGDPYDLGRSDDDTRAALELFTKYPVNFQILTKGGTNAVRDFDLYRKGDRFGCTLTFIDPEKSKKREPGAALPEDRIEALKIAHERGIETWASLEPVIDPSETLELIERTHEFVDIFAVGKWNHDQRANRIDWDNVAKDVVERFERLGCTYLIKEDLAKHLPKPDQSATKKRPFFEPSYLELARKHHGRISNADLDTEFPDEADRKRALFHLDILVQSYGWEKSKLKSGLVTWTPPAEVMA